jgi:transcriptional regulator of acetoin/glycerol metabolism
VLYPEDFPQEIQSRGKGEISSIPVGEPFVFQDQTIETMEKHHIVRMLQEAEFNKSKAADLLGIDRATLYRKARRYQISLHDSITPA